MIVFFTVLENECVKIKVEVQNDKDETQTMKYYVLISDFKVIKENKNKEVTV